MKAFGRHNLSGVVGSTYEQNDVIEATVEASDFASDLQLNVTSGTKKTTTSSTNNSRLNGYFARVAYDFDSKYLFEVSGRRDGSSRFAENNKYEFWALSGGWNIANEEFMSNVKLFSDLKLRASELVVMIVLVILRFSLYSGGTDGAYNGAPGFNNTT
jgi:hypothetical protein